MNTLSSKFQLFYAKHKRFVTAMAYVFMLTVIALSTTGMTFATDFNIDTYVNTKGIANSIGGALEWIGPLVAIANFILWLLTKDDRKKEAAKWGMIGGIVALLVGLGLEKGLYTSLVKYMKDNWAGTGGGNP